MEISKSLAFQEHFGIPYDALEATHVPSEAIAVMLTVIDEINQPIDAPKIVIERSPFAGNPDDDIPAPWWDSDYDGDIDPPDEVFWPKPF